MAVPVLLGLPWLLSGIGSFFVSAFTYFTAVTAKRLAFIVVALAIFVTLTIAFIAVLTALLDTIVAPVPSLQSVYLILPSNFPTVISVMISAKLARWAYIWNLTAVKMASRV